MPVINCVCDASFDSVASSTPGVLTVVGSGDSIRLLQTTSGDIPTSNFEYVLRNIRFAHGPSRPDKDYTAFIRVTANDGQFGSEVATTRIDVQVSNQAPRVEINDQNIFQVVMQDGDERIPLLPNASSISVIEDSRIINSLSIILVNPAHSDEQIMYNVSDLPSSLTFYINGQSFILNGTATPTEYIDALASLSLEYYYPPMESILQGDIPDFTPRYMRALQPF